MVAVENLPYWGLVDDRGNTLYRDSMGIVLPHSLLSTRKLSPNLQLAV